MPVRNAGVPFSIGIDITQISRFRHYCDHPWGLKSMHYCDDPSGLKSNHMNKLLRFFDKIFTAPEQQLFWHRYQGTEKLRSDSRARTDATQYLASRWAAKEAIIKAWKARRLQMLDIEIHARERQAPLAIVLDKKRPHLFETSEKIPGERQARRILREWMESNVPKGLRQPDSIETDHGRAGTGDRFRTLATPNGVPVGFLPHDSGLQGPNHVMEAVRRNKAYQLERGSRIQAEFDSTLEAFDSKFRERKSTELASQEAQRSNDIEEEFAKVLEEYDLEARKSKSTDLASQEARDRNEEEFAKLLERYDLEARKSKSNAFRGQPHRFRIERMLNPIGETGDQSKASRLETEERGRALESFDRRSRGPHPTPFDMSTGLHSTDLIEKGHGQPRNGGQSESRLPGLASHKGSRLDVEKSDHLFRGKRSNTMNNSRRLYSTGSIEEDHEQPEIRDQSSPLQAAFTSHKGTRPDEGEFDRTMPVPEDTNGEEVAISISHDGDYCIAMAIVPVAH
ncbi:hypothetical protein MBLNU457_6349t1 [Dothideomycetes sp. NU457]